MKDSESAEKESPSAEGPSQLKKLGVLGAMGFEFVGFIIGGTLVGRWLEGHFDIAPWGVISMILLGMLGAFWHIYQVITRYLK